MKNTFLLLMLLMNLSGCAWHGSGGSFVGELPAETYTLNTIAQDVATHIAEGYAAGHTALTLNAPEKKAQNAFHATLENALRQKGFALTQGKTLQLSYTIDKLEDAVWYVQIRLSDGLIFARTYTALGIPEAGMTQHRTKEDGQTLPPQPREGFNG